MSSHATPDAIDTPPTDDTIRAQLQALGRIEPDACDTVSEAIRLAGALLTVALAERTRSEAADDRRLARLMEDEQGRLFTTAFTDQVLRPRRPARVADQVRFLLAHYGVPGYFGWFEHQQLRAFKWLGGVAPGLLIPRVLAKLRREVRRVALPPSSPDLDEALAARAALGMRVNLNHLGEAILGENEATQRHAVYLKTLARPDIASVSIKVSSIASQLNLLAWEDTLDTLAERVSALYDAAMAHPITQPDGSIGPKLVNLDMEEYRDLGLTVALFKRVLANPKYRTARTSIVLQAYLPDTYPVLQDLVAFATARVAAGGTPIRIRLVKGANLAMERVDAALHGWARAPYTSKADVDANYKRLVDYALVPEHARVAHVGIASHNLFDIAWAMVLRATRKVEAYSGFEMLEGIARPLARVVARVSGDLLIYAPTAADEDLLSAIAYLIRRLDENTGPDNFLRASFGMTPGGAAWEAEKQRFATSVIGRGDAPFGARRAQDRDAQRDLGEWLGLDTGFNNEADTDWALPANRAWIERHLVAPRLARTDVVVPCQIAGEDWVSAETIPGSDPSRPGVVPYRVAQADLPAVDRALTTAQRAAERWAATPWTERAQIVARVAVLIRRARGELIATMVLDAGKAVPEGDAEVSEAIDFAEYYRRALAEAMALPGLAMTARGVVLVTPPWNFPFAIPAGGVFAALLAGNSVILKAPPETPLTAWELAKLCWEGGVPRDVLQFIACPNDPVGTQLIRDPRVAAVILTGGTATAHAFLGLRPELPLFAETGGKNAMIVTEMADHDSAIKHALTSAFGHAGQKCSATSLLILEAPLYDDADFRRRLLDAASSLPVGSAWDPVSRVTPLIRPPRGDLAWALTELDPGEEWLLAPRAHPENPQLWSPGIKLGVKPGSRTHQRELFGPVLAVMRAEDLTDALAIANGTPYGLTAALQSLDPREQEVWLAHMDAGCLYLNRGTTGAIVRRQPFGGRKASCLGPGAKAGGPNYLLQLMHIHDGDDAPPVHDYAAAFEAHFAKPADPSCLLGQDNWLVYQPLSRMLLRLGEGAREEDTMRAILAARVAGTPLIVSALHPEPWHAGIGADVVFESAGALAARLAGLGVHRVRALGAVERDVLVAGHPAGIHVDSAPVVQRGRVELLRYLHEQTRAIDYHRFGNLGERERDERAAIA